MFFNHEHSHKLLHIGAILIVIAILFVSYYVLIARPRIKADCLQAATNVVSKGEDSGKLFDRGPGEDQGEEVIFDEAKYNQCVSIF